MHPYTKYTSEVLGMKKKTLSLWSKNPETFHSNIQTFNYIQWKLRTKNVFGYILV